MKELYSNGFASSIAQAIEEMKADQGDGFSLDYWRPAEIASKGPARKANCGAKEKAITEFFQILYTELALNSACRAAYFCTYNLSPRKYLHPLADKGRQQ